MPMVFCVPTDIGGMPMNTEKTVKDAKERTHYWTDVQAVTILLRYPMTF